MKGLIIKDFMCLRKQMVIFSFVIVVLFIVSIMVVLSAKFGNLYSASQEIINSSEMADIGVDNLANMSLLFFMLCPLALTGETTKVFEYDGKAGFASLSSILPLSIEKRVLAKYISASCILGIGVLIDIVIAFVLSLLTDIVTFEEFFGIIISCASIFLMYGAISIFFCFCLGYGKEQYASIIAVLLMCTVFVVRNIQSFKQFFTANNNSDMYITKDVLNYLKYNFYVPLIIAIAITLISYVASTVLLKRKRGMI